MSGFFLEETGPRLLPNLNREGNWGLNLYQPPAASNIKVQNICFLHENMAVSLPRNECLLFPLLEKHRQSQCLHLDCQPPTFEVGFSKRPLDLELFRMSCDEITSSESRNRYRNWHPHSHEAAGKGISVSGGFDKWLWKAPWTCLKERQAFTPTFPM